MSTIIGIECADGAVLAGDTADVSGGSVRSTSKERVFDLGDYGAAAVGASGSIDAFERRLDTERRQYETEQAGELTVETLARRAADVADDEGVDVLVCARDEDGTARIRAVARDGGVTDDPYAAFGTGAPMAMGQLETADRDVDLDEAEALVREILSAVEARDAETDGDVDVYRLASAE